MKPPTLRVLPVLPFLILLLPVPARADWSALGSGTNGQVLALSLLDRTLIAGGLLTLAGEDSALHVARWDGEIWTSLGVGVSGQEPGHPPATVFALTVFRGELIAGGSFTHAGGVPSANIARWNGASWDSLGFGAANMVTSLAVYDSSLIAAGWFTRIGGIAARHIARWDGTAWHPLGSGINSSNIVSLIVYRGDLIAGGQFTEAGGQACSNIARWDGTSWHPMPGTDGTIEALAVYQDKLIAGGNFTHAGGVATNYIAQWDGSSWAALGSGTGGGYYTPDVTMAATWSDSLLVIGGHFTMAGGHPARYVASWDGMSWSPLGSGLGSDNGVTVNAARPLGEGIVIGGSFDSAGGYPIHNIAVWDGPGSDGIDELPLQVGLRRGALPVLAFPNPSAAGTVLRCDVPASGPARVMVHDPGGRVVATLLDRESVPGRRLIPWNGLDTAGRKVPAGVYIIRVQNREYVGSTRVTIER